MKTHILQLEQHDDIISTCDKMAWAKSGRLLLVWPERGSLLNRRLDLVLLQRHSLALGAQLALVSRDPDVRYHAPRLGIPVFKSLRQAQSAAWRLPRRFRSAQEAITPDRPAGARELPTPPNRPRPLAHPLARLGVFTLGVLAFLSIAALLLPGAEISLTPKTELQTSQIEVQASPETEQVDISGKVPARWLTVIVEGRDSQPVSGQLAVPDRPAIGHVLFTNLTDQPVEVPEGSIVRSLGPGGLRFTTTQAGEVPAGPGQTLSLPVRCLSPGPQGNLPAGELSAIEDLLGTQLSATNPLPMKHGSERREPAPSQADRQQLSDQLSTALYQTALQEFQNNLASEDLLLPESLELVAVLEQDFEPAEGQPADYLQLSLRLEFQALILPGEALLQLAQLVLNTNLPAGYKPLDEATFSHISTPVLEPGPLVSGNIRASRQIQAQLREPQAIQLALGLAPAQAQERLYANLPLESPPQISLTPAWWPRLPILPFRILVHYPGERTAVEWLPAARR